MLGFIALLLVVAICLLAALIGRLRKLHADVQILLRRSETFPPRQAPAPAPSISTPPVEHLELKVQSLPIPPPRPPPLPATAYIPTTPPPLPTPIPRPPPAPTVPRPRSKLAESAQDVLHRIWNWILVGEEHRPKGVTSEYAIATTWLLRLGILACVLCVGYFLKWSSERDLVSPAGRVAIAILTGLAMLVAGIRLLGRKYHVMGQGLLGGGLLVLYFAAYAMGPLYHLVSLTASFGIMILVTLVAGVLALRLDSMLVAIIGLAGGYLTPVLIRTPTPNLPVFYAYMLLLGIAMLAIAWRKQWRLLNYLSFICTYVLFIGSLDAYHQETDFPLTLGFLTSFFVIQSSLVFFHNVTRRIASTTLDITHLAANAILYAALGYTLIYEAHGRPWPMWLALGLAVFYTLHVLALLRRRSEDRPLVVGMIALAGAFATWTLPLVLERESLTIALALLAFTFLWLGQKMESRFLQNLAHALYLVVFARLALWDFDRSYRHHPAPDLPMRAYWPLMLDRLTTFGITIASVVGAFILQQRQPKTEPALAVPPRADTPLLLGDSLPRRIFYWTALAGIVAFLNFELSAMFAYATAWRLPVLTVVWSALALYFLHAQASEERPASMFWAMTATLVIATLKLLAVDLRFWDCSDTLVYAVAYRPLDAAARLLDFGALIAAFLFVWHLVRTRPEPSRGGRDTTRPNAPLFGYAALFLLLAYATLEWNTLLYWKFKNFQAGGLSMLWAAFAIAYLASGIWKNIKALRYIGLALMALVIAKVFLSDLRDMEVIVRVVAFFVVGILLLLGSFAYMYSNRKFSKNEPES